MTNKIHSMLADIIRCKMVEAAENNVWAKDGSFNDIQQLSNDAKGKLGEEFLAKVLEHQDYKPKRSSATDRTNKHWDIKIQGGITMEVKTATIGSAKPTFQHEAIEKDRNYDLLVCLDITPSSVYLTVAPKHTLPFTNKNKNWSIRPKKMHSRGYGIHYKWTLSLKDVKAREVRTAEDISNMFDDAIKAVRSEKRRKKGK